VVAAAAGVPHAPTIATTQRYADYAPSAHEAAFVEAAFGLASEVEVALVKTT
jgi:hypothetical protein